MDQNELMGENVKKHLKKCGKNVIIRPLAKIAKPEMVEIGDDCIIDDFVFINGGSGTRIGHNVHIASFCSLIGGGTLEIRDFAGIAAGCRIITGSDDFSGESLTNPSIPKEFKPHTYTGHVTIGRHVICGTNTVVFPNVTLNDYCATAANTLVNKSLDSENIYLGTPARKMKPRPKKKLLELEKLFMAKLALQAKQDLPEMSTHQCMENQTTLNDK